MIKGLKIKSLAGSYLVDIGRILHPDIYDVDVPFRDYDGPVYLKFNKGYVIFHPIPTISGDFIEIYDDETFSWSSMKDVSFIDYFPSIKGGKLKDIELSKQEEGITEIQLIFDEFRLRVFLSGGDELDVEVIVLD